MKKKMLFAMSLVFLMVACQTNIPKDKTSQEVAKSSSPNIEVKEHLPLAEFLQRTQNGEETFVQYSYVGNLSSTYTDHICKWNTAPNTMMLSENVGVRIQDEFVTENVQGKNICHIRRNAYVVSSEQGEDSTNNAKKIQTRTQEEPTLEIDIETSPVDPIYILNPYSTDCNPIPMCYYHAMDVEWNADLTNPTQVIIITEWNGLKMDGSSIDTTVIHHTITSDDGLCTLNDNMYADMPDEALVNIWLIRANVVTVYYDGPISINDVREIIHNDPTKLDKFFYRNPEFLYSLETTMLVYGAVTHLPIYLIRNTQNPIPARI